MHIRVGIIILSLVALIGAGCGGSGLRHAATNPETKKDLSQAEAIVKGCINKGNVLSHSGRKAVISCIAPPGHKVQFEQCATKAVTKDIPLHRKKLAHDLAVCVEANR